MNLDRPASWSEATEKDKVGRAPFAKAAANALMQANASGGLAVSIEGDWGSGKTFTLSLIEAQLRSHSVAPVIAHFNPWLVGEKDALLRQFLSNIAKAIESVDHSQAGKKAAKEIKAYAKIFDVLKLVPGAEPWSSSVKSVFEAVGDIAEHKARDIDDQKTRVEAALREQQRVVVVFIDDIDRLYPAEVFEMIRIIKAVGDLPFVAYALAWDSNYVSKALEGLGVPFASSYLDKVVQVRMPLPVLSEQARQALVNAALDDLPGEATAPHFLNQGERLASMYRYGIRRLLEHPRDITRLFNAVEQIEPLLRGEIVLADIIGFTALTIKAPTVDQLIRRQPNLFVPGTDSDDESLSDFIRGTGERNEARKQRVEQALELALANHPNPAGVRATICQLFPSVAELLRGFSYVQATIVEGSIGHHSRLSIALQLKLTNSDISIKQALRFLKRASDRVQVIKLLTRENASSFLLTLRDLTGTVTELSVGEITKLALDIARVPDSPSLGSTEPHSGWLGSSSSSALSVVDRLTRQWSVDERSALARQIVADPLALSCAAEIIADNFISERRAAPDDFKLTEADKADALAVFGANVLSVARTGELFDTEHPGWTLAVLGRAATHLCPPVFEACKEDPQKLDNFAVAFLARVKDSHKGQAYGLSPEEPLRSAFCPVKELRQVARDRLLDTNLDGIARIAWRAVAEDKTLYGRDGSEYRE